MASRPVQKDSVSFFSQSIEFIVGVRKDGERFSPRILLAAVGSGVGGAAALPWLYSFGINWVAETVS